MQIGQGNRVCDCHFVFRINGKFIFYRRETGMVQKNEQECRPKVRISVKASIRKNLRYKPCEGLK